MWSDNETNRDFLNFRTVAVTAAEMISQANGQPLSLGVSGNWGVGKSSMIRLIRDELESRSDKTFLTVEFNAWLYQGFDDARAALMETIANALLAHAKDNQTAVDKATEFLKRVNWVRAAGLAVGSGMSMAFGLPPTGLLGEAVRTYQGLADGEVTQEDLDAAKATGSNAGKAGSSLIKQAPQTTPPQEIQDLRRHFSDTLKDMDITLVVFIDDLDRCLPNTAIATLEAIRLFLFLEHTAFIIAADDKMIRRAVRAHFQSVDLDDELVTNYFDKLIQVPLRVPPLGTQDVRAYLMLLFIENSELSQEKRDSLREDICTQLGQTWLGKRVDRAFVAGLIKECPEQLSHQLDLADRLAPIMTTSPQISGNPRLIKRFLNTLSIRMSIARSQNVPADEAALAKMLLFERCGSEAAYADLVRAINEHDKGKPLFLGPWEEAVASGGELPETMPQAWQDEFVKDWLALSPPFADLDLRAVAYVSREHLPIIAAADQLSPEGADLLGALYAVKEQPSKALAVKLKTLSKREITFIMARLLDRARTVDTWGRPPILNACLTVIEADDGQAEPLANFLRRDIPLARLEPSIVVLLAHKTWAKAVLTHWANQSETPGPVKKAIASEAKGKK
ncbi:MAG: P-loop NTPase fold protein [Alphaproteobacteria bacterium]